MPRNNGNRKRRRRSNRSIRKQVKAILDKNTETKRYSYSHNTTLSTTGSTLAMLDSVVAGTGSNQRIGHEIRLTGFYTKLSFGVADSTNLIRVVVYKARQTGLTLQSDGVTVISTIDPDKYFIYYDSLVQLNTTDRNLAQRTIKLNLRNQLVRYDASTGAPVQNSIQLYMVSDSGAVTHPSVQGVSYIYYKDM